VVGLGLVNLDLVAVADAVERDHKAQASALFSQVGGPVPVALAAMARLGLESPPAFIGAVGADADGDMVAALLAEGRVDTSGLARAPGAATSRSLVLLDARDGTRTLANWPGTTPPLLPFTPVQAALLDGAGLLHLDGRDLAASLDAARRVWAAGGLVSLDLGTMRPGRDALLALCDIVIASKKGGAGAFPDAAGDPAEQARRFLELGAAVTGVTLGPAGVVIAARGERGGDPVRLPAFAPPGPVADTCGAGDLFHGAFLWAYRADRSALDAADFAQAAVAVRVTRRGNAAGLSTRAEVKAFLASNPPRL
jgi:sugar/nucleoside kinase (ribokinase family)